MALIRSFGPLDANGLYRFRNRYYDPSIARFTQPDPSGEVANPFTYGAGYLIRTSDPTGLEAAGPYAQVCFVLCVGANYAEDEETGEQGISLSTGLGFGVDAGVQVGELISGLGDPTSCVGFFVLSAHADSGGEESFTLGAGTSVVISTTISYTWTFRWI